MTHETYVVEHGASRSTIYASCSCGWSGPPRRSMAKVTADNRRHVGDHETGAR